MQSILDTTKDFIRKAIKEDSIVADFTMGNGGDTCFLAELVPQGHVYAFDIQPQALENTKAKLDLAGHSNCTLILDCHSKAYDYITGSIDAGMFNLGYLPGFDKAITTKENTTLIAIDKAMNMLKKDGVLVINVYPGHEEGRIEGEKIGEMLSKLDKKLFDCLIYRIFNIPECPYIYLVQKR